jgi:hypothetical protein
MFIMLNFQSLKHEQLIDIIMFIHGNQFHPNQRIFSLC